MTRFIRLFRVGWLIPLVVTICGTHTFADTDLPRLWSVSDDTLSTPFGTIIDVAVGVNNDVYLLDSQNMLVRCISAEGMELPAIGGRGDGPGEFRYPVSLSVNSNNECTVFQDFYQPAVCIHTSGVACAVPDLSEIVGRFNSSVIRHTRAGGKRRLLLYVLTSDAVPKSVSRSVQTPPGNSLFAVIPDGSAPKILFSDRPELCDENTVLLQENNPGFLDWCWDVDRDGRIIYADPLGGYGIVMGHPVDGESVVLDLPEKETDEDNLDRLADLAGIPRESLPKIAAVHWVGPDRFLIKPMACIPRPSTPKPGIIELFDTYGKSYGRENLNCEYNPDQDKFYIRNGILVVIRGGKSAIVADISQKAALIGKQIEPPSNADHEFDGIRIDAYSLISRYSAQ